MLKNFLIFFFFTYFLSASFAGFTQNIDKKTCMSAFSVGKISQIDAQLNLLEKFTGTDKEAYQGALLMRKSGLLSIPAKKLAMFKEGHKKLENAIAKNPDDAEFRFLRLMVQENAPKALGYNKNIKQDGDFIRANYKNMPEIVQQSIINYSRTSKVLNGSF